MSNVALLLPPTRYKMCMSLREGRRQQDEPRGPDIKYFFKEKEKKKPVLGCLLICNIDLFLLFDGSCLFSTVRVQNAWACFTLLSWVTDYLCGGGRPPRRPVTIAAPRSVQLQQPHSRWTRVSVSHVCHTHTHVYIYRYYKYIQWYISFSSGFSGKNLILTSMMSSYRLLFSYTYVFIYRYIFASTVIFGFSPVAPQS